MATEKQIAANRANAQKSTGPRTPRGKAAVSQNAVTHGLLAKSVVLQSESQERFSALLAWFASEYDPQGPTQTALVQMMAVSQWRLLRAWNMEVAGMDYEFNRQSDPAAPQDFAAMETPTRAHFALRALGAGEHSIDVMNRYEARLERQFHRAFLSLCRLQGRKPVSPPLPGTSFFEKTKPIGPLPESHAPGQEADSTELQTP